MYGVDQLWTLGFSFMSKEATIFCGVLMLLVIVATFSNANQNASSQRRRALPKNKRWYRTLATRWTVGSKKWLLSFRCLAPFRPKPIEPTPEPREIEPNLSHSLVCPICFDDYKTMIQSNRMLVSTKCGHLFCNECIKEVVRQLKSCPKCRTRLATVRAYHTVFM